MAEDGLANSAEEISPIDICKTSDCAQIVFKNALKMIKNDNSGTLKNLKGIYKVLSLLVLLVNKKNVSNPSLHGDGF